MTGPTEVTRISEREFVVSRTFAAPVDRLYEAWTQPDVFARWWAPKSMGVPLTACEMDVRVGGGYRLVYGAAPGMAFFGAYREVVPNARLVWTNAESPDAPVTTVTFEGRGEETLLAFRETYPAKEACDEAFAGMPGMMDEQFAQLDELLAAR